MPFFFFKLYVPADSDVTLSQWMDIFFQLHHIWSHWQLILDIITWDIFLNLQPEHKGKGIVIFYLFLWKFIFPPTSVLLQSRIHKTKEFDKTNQIRIELCWGPFLHLCLFLTQLWHMEFHASIFSFEEQKKNIILKYKHKCILCIKTNRCSKAKLLNSSIFSPCYCEFQETNHTPQTDPDPRDSNEVVPYLALTQTLWRSIVRQYGTNQNFFTAFRWEKKRRKLTLSTAPM